MGDATELLEYLYERNTAAQGSAVAPRTSAPAHGEPDETTAGDIAALTQFMGPAEPLPPHLRAVADYVLEQEKKLHKRS